MRGQAGFFDIEERLKELSAKGDTLERLNGFVDFELFRPDLERAVPRADGSSGGRPPFDHVLMFKVLILQASHTLSDERTEFLIKDRLSFMRFLGLGLADPVPDANTIWTFREALTRATLEGPARDRGAVRGLRGSPDSGRLPGDGRPDRRRLHHRRPEAAQHGCREARHQGGAHPGRVGGQACQARAEGPGRALDGEVVEGQAGRRRLAAHRPRGARLRLQEPCRHRPAPRPDPHLDGDGRGPSRRGPTAHPDLEGKYRQRCVGRYGLSFKANEKLLAENGRRSQIHRKKPPRKPMPKHTARANGAKSKVRAAVEHVFAHEKGPMGLVVRTIGLARARVKIGLANLVYNMKRAIWLTGRLAPA